MNTGLKISFISLLICSLNSVEASAQCYFNHLYDNDSAYEAGYSVIQTLDNGYLVGGTTLVLGGYTASYLVKLDSCGDTLWTKSYDLGLGGTDDIEVVIQLSDSNLILSGTTSDTINFNTNGYLMKTDRDGNLIWSQEYGGLDIENCKALDLTSDGGFIMAGYTTNGTGGAWDAWVAKTDSVGGLEWEKQFGGSSDDIFESVRQTSDAGYICAGTTTVGPTDGDIYLVKLNAVGDTLWTKKYGDSESDAAWSLDITIDGGYVIAGGKTLGGDEDPYVIKTDSLGTVEWENTYPMGPHGENFQSIKELADGSLIVAGIGLEYNAPPPAPRGRGRLVKLTSDGDTLWSKIYDYYGGDSDYILFDMKPTDDNGFVFCGYIINNPNGQKNDVWVVKVDSMGNTCEVDTTMFDQGCNHYGTLIGVSEQSTSQSMNDINIYPNPCLGSFTLEVQADLEPVSTVRVYNSQGAIIFEREDVYTKHLQISLNNSTEGIYFVKITSGQQIFGRKIIVR